MGVIGNLIVQLTADISRFQRDMEASTKVLDRTQKSFRATARRLEQDGQSMMLGVTAPLALIGGTAIKSAMDVVESENLFSVAMGDMAASAQEFSETLRQQLGLNAYEVRNNIATLFDMTTAMGISRKTALDMSEGITLLAYDLASFKNLRPEEAFEKLQSGIVGEAEPLRRLGVLVDETTIKAIALKSGLIQQGQEMSQQQKVVARYMAIMEQTKNAQGDMARTIDSPTNQLRIFSQALKQAQISLGQGLMPFVQSALPMLRRFAERLGEVGQAFASLPPPVRNTIVGFTLLAVAAGPVVYGMSLISRGIATAAGALSAITALSSRAVFAFGAWIGGAASLGEALTFVAGGPVRLWIAGALGIAAVVLVVAAKWQQLAGLAHAVWNGISAVVLYASSLVVRGVGAMLSVIGLIIPSVRGAASAVNGYAESLKMAASNALGMAKTNLAANAMQQQANAANQAAGAGQDAAKGQQQVADAMKDAAKQAGQGIQSFDEIHQVQEQMADAAGSSLPGFEMPAIQMPEIPSLDMGGLGAGLGDMFGGMVEGLQTAGQNLAAAWQSITGTITGLWEQIKGKALEVFPFLPALIDAVNVPIQWIRDNWPTIGPIVEGIAGVMMTLMVPALIKTGVEATIAGTKAVASWVAQGIAATVEGAKIVAQILLAVAKWTLLGITAPVEAAKVVTAWAIQGWEAVASVGKQLLQFGLAIGQWIVLGAESLVQAGRVVAAWVMQKVEAVASVGAQVAQFGLVLAQWALLGIESLVQAGKVVAAWVMQKAEAIASIAVQVVQFGILIAQWVAMGVAALAGAAQVALAWLIAMGPIALVVAAIVGLAVLIYAYWDEIKAYTVKVWQGLTEWLSKVWEGVKQTATTVWNAIKSFFTKWWDELLVAFTGPIGFMVKLIVDNWDTIKAATEKVWTGITAFLSTLWSGIKSTASTVWTAITSSVSSLTDGTRDALVKTWTGLSTTLRSIWDGISGAASSIWDGIVGIVKGAINWIIRGINGFLGAMSAIRINVPQVDIPLVGKVGGFSIGLPSLPQIPMLADGGNVVGSGLAITGEAGAELLDLPSGARVTPLGAGNDLAAEIAQAVHAAVMDAMRMVLSQMRAGAGEQREIVLEIDGQRFARLILPALERESERSGPTIVRLQGV